MTKGKVRHHQTHQAVNRPDMKTPVEKGNLHGLLGRIHGFCRPGRGLRIMQHRLRHPEEQQGDAVTGGKQHGEPFRE